MSDSKRHQWISPADAPSSWVCANCFQVRDLIATVSDWSCPGFLPWSGRRTRRTEHRR